MGADLLVKSHHMRFPRGGRWQVIHNYFSFIIARYFSLVWMVKYRNRWSLQSSSKCRCERSPTERQVDSEDDFDWRIRNLRYFGEQPIMKSGWLVNLVFLQSQSSNHAVLLFKVARSSYSFAVPGMLFAVLGTTCRWQIVLLCLLDFKSPSTNKLRLQSWIS